MLRLGIVGLPNVGKSTLFNALTSSKAAAAENYPFCTVEPNIGVVEVPDPRLDRLFQLVKPKKKVPAVVEFVDIAGLVKGASQGEGLGNQFLSHIREVDAIVHVIRCFEDPDVVHVMGPVDPVRDHDIVTGELALADLAVVERRLEKARKTARAGDKDAQAELGVLERVIAELDAGRGAREAGESDEAIAFLRRLGLLTAKPILYAANVDEDDLASGGGRWLEQLRAAVQAHHEEAEIVPFSARFEAELADLSGEERREYLAAAGVGEPGLDRLIHAGYRLLGLQTFFTVGENEVRARTIHRGETAGAEVGNPLGLNQPPIQIQGKLPVPCAAKGDREANVPPAPQLASGLAEERPKRERAATRQVFVGVIAAEPHLLSLVESREGPREAHALGFDHDRRELHRRHVQEDREPQRLAALEGDLVLVGQAVAVPDAQGLAAGRESREREQPSGVAHVEDPGSPHGHHHPRERSAVDRGPHRPGESGG